MKVKQAVSGGGPAYIIQWQAIYQYTRLYYTMAKTRWSSMHAIEHTTVLLFKTVYDLNTNARTRQ